MRLVPEPVTNFRPKVGEEVEALTRYEPNKPRSWWKASIVKATSDVSGGGGYDQCVYIAA